MSKKTKNRKIKVRQKPEFTAALVAFRMDHGRMPTPREETMLVHDFLESRPLGWNQRQVEAGGMELSNKKWQMWSTDFHV